MIRVRKPTLYGDVFLSVQANEYTYCSPRVSGLKLHEYRAVEIALIRKGGGGFIRPSEIGIKGFDNLFEKGGVAGLVPSRKVWRLRRALRERTPASKS